MITVASLPIVYKYRESMRFLFATSDNTFIGIGTNAGNCCLEKSILRNRLSIGGA